MEHASAASLWDRWRPRLADLTAVEVVLVRHVLCFNAAVQRLRETGTARALSKSQSELRAALAAVPSQTPLARAMMGLLAQCACLSAVHLMLSDQLEPASQVLLSAQSYVDDGAAHLPLPYVSDLVLPDMLTLPWPSSSSISGSLGVDDVALTFLYLSCVCDLLQGGTGDYNLKLRTLAGRTGFTPCWLLLGHWAWRRQQYAEAATYLTRFLDIVPSGLVKAHTCIVAGCCGMESEDGSALGW